MMFCTFLLFKHSMSHLLNDNEIAHIYTISIITYIIITKPNYIVTIQGKILLHEGAKYNCKQRE